jgi:hypothetical protein
MYCSLVSHLHEISFATCPIMPWVMLPTHLRMPAHCMVLIQEMRFFSEQFSRLVVALALDGSKSWRRVYQSLIDKYTPSWVARGGATV